MTARIFTTLSTLALCVTCLFSQSFAINLIHFPGNDDRGESIGFASSATLNKGTYSAGSWLNYTAKPLEFGDDSGQTIADIVNGVFTVHPHFSYGISDTLSVGLHIPVHVYNSIDTPASFTSIFPNFETENSASLGDIALSAQYAITQKSYRQKGPWGIGVIANAIVPVGNGTLLRSSGPKGQLSFAFDKWMSEKSLFASTVGASIGQEESFSNLSIGSELLFGLSYLFGLSSRTDFIAEINGRTSLSGDFGKELNTPVELSLASRFRFGKTQNNHFTIGAARGLDNGYGAPELRIFAGIRMASAQKATRAPSRKTFDTPAPAPQVSPRTTPAPTPFPTPIATPAPVVKAKPGVITVLIRNENNQNIEANITISRLDGKGRKSNRADAWTLQVPKGQYKIDVSASGYHAHNQEFLIAAGAASTKTILLEKIAAPKPVVKKARKKPKGAITTRIKVGRKINLLWRVSFNSSSSVIKKSSYTVINDVVNFLKRNPSIKMISIEAHTDSSGDDESNLDLSFTRADAVLAYMIKKGINPQRLSSNGFGEEKPIASNKTKTGRAQNRRVDFVIKEIK